MASDVIVEMIIELVTVMRGLDSLLPAAAPVKPPSPRFWIRHVISSDIRAKCCSSVIFSDNAMELSHPVRGSKFLEC